MLFSSFRHTFTMLFRIEKAAFLPLLSTAAGTWIVASDLFARDAGTTARGAKRRRVWIGGCAATVGVGVLWRFECIRKEEPIEIAPEHLEQSARLMPILD